MRHPEWGREWPEDYDGISAARDSLRMHELRGLVIGQVAEIENLLMHIVSVLQNKPFNQEQSTKKRSYGAGNVLSELEKLLEKENLCDDRVRLRIGSIRQVIRQRNRIVHAIINVGYAYIAFNDSRDAVVSYRIPNALVSDAPDIQAVSVEDDEISEYSLQQQLLESYKGLDDCIDILQEVDSVAKRKLGPENEPLGGSWVNG